MGAAAFAATAMLLGTMTTAASNGVDDPVVQRALAAFAERATQHQTIRRLRAGTLKGKHTGWLDAEVAVEPERGLSYRVLGEGGSERTRQKVLRGVLDAERDTVDNWERGAITPANYEFAPDVDAGPDGLRRVRVIPRRDDPRLVDGVLTVTPAGRPLTLEGRLAKTPSFWVRSVTVIRRFDTIDGLTLPVAVESLADLRFVGPSAFSMVYEYRAVNGVPVNDSATSRESGPSSYLLALHAAFKAPFNTESR